MHTDTPQPPSYYDVSILKPPVWKWEIAAYFFFGGLSAGAYVIGHMAERFGRRPARRVRRAGTAIAALAAIPCAPLLIKDLGHMARFHHMLRVFKPQTPMNLGSWTLAVFSGTVAIAAAREGAARGGLPVPASVRRQLRDGRLPAVTEAAGVPLALVMMTYSGVLLSCTSNPSWTRNPWLAPLFVSSSFGSGAAAIRIALAARRRGREDESASAALERVETAAQSLEAVCLAGYLVSLGERARPFLAGRQAPQVAAAAAALIVPHALSRLPLPRRLSSALAGAVALAGAFALRWAIVHAGQESARDPDLARRATGTP